MRTAVEIIWWIGLIGALPATLVILKAAILVIERLRRIHKLANLINLAAHGIAVHLAPAARLHNARDLIKQIDDAVGELATAIALVESRVNRPEAIVPSLAKRPEAFS